MITTFNHHFKGFFSRVNNSECKVYLNQINGLYCFCFEDIGIGTSVTNASEFLATEMVEKFKISPILCKFYETYVHEERTFDEITYTWVNNVASKPQWKPSNEQHLFDF